MSEFPPIRRAATASTGKLADRVFNWSLRAVACLILLLAAGLLIQLVVASWPSVTKFGFGFLVSSEWNPVRGRYGALPFVYGTLFSSLVALALALPLALGIAIFLVELAPSWLRRPASTLVELLAAIPSVVYGLWGLFVLVPWLQRSVEPPLGQALGWFPLFSGPPYGVGMLAAGLVLAIMILPIIASVVRDVLSAVPLTQREAAIGLGATRWEATRLAVLPAAKPGIIGATILGLGRALGETMAVTLLIGNTPQISASLFEPASTMASVIANEFNEAAGLQQSALTEIALVLLVVTVVVNAIARLLVRRTAKGTG